MGKHTFKPNPRSRQVWEDLERYLDFCRNFGYKFNEADLYNNRVYAFQQFRKWEAGKDPRDMWAQDVGRYRR